MKKNTILLLLFILLPTLQIFAITPPDDESKDKNKITLSFLTLHDKALEFVTSDINNMIMRKNRGFLWPATKIVFSQDGDRLLFKVTAIDNSWCKMFEDGENPYGYIVVNGRVFIISVNTKSPVDIEKYFVRDTTLQRTFDRPVTAKLSKNPVWFYLHKGHMATVLDSVYMESLGR